MLPQFPPGAECAYLVVPAGTINNSGLEMKITIQGLDYTCALDAHSQLTIERKLNQPSVCEFELFIPVNGDLMPPERSQSISICGDDGTVYFTGYIATNPIPEYLGLALAGPVSRLRIVGSSDEAQLDEGLFSFTGEMVGGTTQSIFENLLARAGTGALELSGLAAEAAISYFAPKASARYAGNLKQAMMMGRVSYRTLNGIVTIAPIGNVLRPIEEAEQSLEPGGLKIVPVLDRRPVNDVTLCGDREPLAYVTEYLRGDGITTEYYLSAEPFASSSSHSVVIRELFVQSEIDSRVWVNSSQPGYLTIGNAGLEVNGGTGVDGQTALSWRDPVELGGTLLIEATGVILSRDSEGMFAGLFDGGTQSSNCILGFRVSKSESSDAVRIQPLVNGSVAGMAFAAKCSNQYTLRARVHSPELHRMKAVYRGSTDDRDIAIGGETVASPGNVQLEIQEFVNGVGGMPVTLFDGTISVLPAICSVVAVSSQSISGSLRSFHLTRLGCGWVVGTPPGGGTYARRLGSPAQGGECQILSGGRLLFQTGFVPVAGETIAVSYRTAGRAIGRAVNLEDQQARSAAGKSEITGWAGSVIEPIARCSADCRNAALVTALTSSSESSILEGTYRGTNLDFEGDVWPGDALLLDVESANLSARVTIREVKVSYTASVPDLVEYHIDFANDWARDLSIKRSSTVPVDAWLQVLPTPTVLPSLSGLVVTSVNGNSVSIDAGTNPPNGGGFEVRRRDFEFMAGSDPGLVTRSTQRNFTFSRETFNDRFFIRSYDDAVPPNYSEFSAALFLNLPFAP